MPWPDTGPGNSEEITITGRRPFIRILKKCLPALHIILRSIVEKGIAVIKERCRTDDGIGGSMGKEAEITKMAIRIGDNGIKDDHILKAVRICRPKLFAILKNYLHASVCDNIAGRDIGNLFAGEQFASGTEHRLPLCERVRNGPYTKNLCNLPGVVF